MRESAEQPHRRACPCHPKTAFGDLSDRQDAVAATEIVSSRTVCASEVGVMPTLLRDQGPTAQGPYEANSVTLHMEALDVGDDADGGGGAVVEGDGAVGGELADDEVGDGLSGDEVEVRRGRGLLGGDAEEAWAGAA